MFSVIFYVIIKIFTEHLKQNINIGNFKKGMLTNLGAASYTYIYIYIY